MSGRRLSHRSFKGPFFKSYITAQLDTTPKRQWLAHSGRRAQLRSLRQKCRHILDSKDPEIIQTGARVLEAVKDEPLPEFGALHLISAGLNASEDTGESWVVCMTYLLDKFEKMEEADGEAEATG